jgi:hypothetical protein
MPYLISSYFLALLVSAYNQYSISRMCYYIPAELCA